MRRMIMAGANGKAPAAPLSAAPTQTQNPTQTDAAAGGVLARSEQASFSGAAAITRHGVTSLFARGDMAAQGSAPITPAARFNIGSAGKMFTAVAIAQLIDAGKVALDDPIGHYVDGLTTA